MARSRGASARHKGHNWERQVVHLITEHVGLSRYATTRNKVKASKGDIAQTIAGSLWVPWVTASDNTRWSIECKATARWSPNQWERQARTNLEVDLGNDGRAVVLVKRPSCRLLDGWAMVLHADPDDGPDPWKMHTIRQFLTTEIHRSAA